MSYKKLKNNLRSNRYPKNIYKTIPWAIRQVTEQILEVLLNIAYIHKTAESIRRIVGKYSIKIPGHIQSKRLKNPSFPSTTILTMGNNKPKCTKYGRNAQSQHPRNFTRQPPTLKWQPTRIHMGLVAISKIMNSERENERNSKSQYG